MHLACASNGILGPIKLTPFVSGQSCLVLPFLLLVTLLALFVRLGDVGYISESLWYEDGSIFVNQSYELGIRSLWMSYAGQQFLYQRIVALLASKAPLIATPYIFSAAWLLAFFSIVCVLKNRGKLAGLNEFLIACLVCAIALQPSSGVPFFNLNHAGVILGIALALYVCIPMQKAASLPDLLFLAVASLTGAFSAFMVPILGLQLAILRDFSSRMATYTIVTICGVIQSVCILRSPRIGRFSINTNPADWLQAASSFLFFGKSEKLIYLVGSMYWLVTLVFLLKWIKERMRQPDRILWWSPLLAAMTATVLYLAAALSDGVNLRLLSPFDWAPRHFLIPYSLAFFISLTCTKGHRTGQMVVIALISIVCVTAFTPVGFPERWSTTGMHSHANLQWRAFAKLQKIMPRIVIPINASLPVYPPLSYIQIKNVDESEWAAAEVERETVLHARQGVSVADESAIDASTINFSSMEVSGKVDIDVENYCATNDYLALEVDIWRSRMGWARVSWGKSGRRDSKQSLERFYPAGDVIMQFAFRRDVSDHLIRFEPAEGVAESTIVRALSARLAPLRLSGVTVAEPTKPGGEVRVKGIRLLCLK